jgi:shikimate dehydrogenase
MKYGTCSCDPELMQNSRKRFTIVGNPARHSKSPALFAAAYPARPCLSYDINEPATVGECLAVLKSGYDGGNVTAPFKEDMFRMADEVSETAALICAVNTVTVTEGKIKADNCDHHGVTGSFGEFGISPAGKSCLLLGIGGAGKAAAYSVCKAGGVLTIVNRTERKARDFADRLGCGFASTGDLNRLAKTSDIIINTLYGDIDLVERDSLDSGKVILDASYIGSPLMEKAKDAGCTIIDGRYWLYHQALYCFTLFTGIEPDRKAMRRLLTVDYELPAGLRDVK